jgi:hypothetical protein
VILSFCSIGISCAQIFLDEYLSEKLLLLRQITLDEKNNLYSSIGKLCFLLRWHIQAQLVYRWLNIRVKISILVWQITLDEKK